MNELFVRFFLAELRKEGFVQAVYDEERERITISPQYSRFFVTYEDNEHLIHYDAGSHALLSKVKTIRDAALMLVQAWEYSEPVIDNSPNQFRKLMAWNDIVLAGRDNGKLGICFATWQYSRDRQSVTNGFYTDSMADAMRNFVGRSGLYPKELLFDGTHLDLIRSSLAYRLEHDGELYLDTVSNIKSILEGCSTTMERNITFYDLLRSGKSIDCDLIIGGTEMPATFVWGESDVLTAYGEKFYDILLKSPYKLLSNGNIEVFCDDYELGEHFTLAAAGAIGKKEHDRLFRQISD